jgi:hypothetical protein
VRRNEWWETEPGKANEPNTETKTIKHIGGSFHSTSSTSRLHHHRLHPEQKIQRESKRKETVRVKKAKGGTEEVLHKASKSTKSTDVLQDDTTSRQLKVTSRIRALQINENDQWGHYHPHLLFSPADHHPLVAAHQIIYLCTKLYNSKIYLRKFFIFFGTFHYTDIINIF